MVVGEHGHRRRAEGDPCLPQVQGRARVPRAGAEDHLPDVQAGVPHRGRHPRHARGRGEAAAGMTLDPRRVLIIQTAWLGDIVFTSALASALMRRWPGAELDLCVSARGKDVARAIPGVRHVLVYDKSGADKGIKGLMRIAARLATRQHDLAVLPHRSLRTAILARLARIPARVGFAGAPGSLFYTSRVRSSRRTFLQRDADLARALGAEPAPMALEARPEWMAS